MAIDLTQKEKKKILEKVLHEYFSNTRIEWLVLEYIGNNTLDDKSSSTKLICEYLKEQEIFTSPGAVRGTILRIRHKLLKYREQATEDPVHLSFPEQNSGRGYRLIFERNTHYQKESETTSPNDMWLEMNWQALREQGYKGVWRGLSLPDGGRWPVRLYLCINTIAKKESGQEVFMCLLNSPSLSNHRMGILSGEIQHNVLHLEGRWCVAEEKGIVDYNLKSKMWPFRRNRNESIRISGRFTIYTVTGEAYQEGQIELDSYSPSVTDDFAEMFTTTYKNEGEI